MEVTIEKRLEGSESGRPAVIWGKDIPSRDNSKCKGPKAEECLSCWSRLGWGERDVGEDESREEVGQIM